ncbi:MAG: DegV family protein [Clostridia bacterium]|nr:DegV family protein [Clostridia bacterium]
MRSFTLTCCSTADMPKEYFEKRDIPYVCFHYTMDGKEYPDDLGQTMPIDEFYSRMKNGACPTTSQVNVSGYIEAFTPILESGSDIVHLTLSSGISGTYGSCITAAEELRAKYPERKIIIIDSLAASSGYGLLTDYAADLRDSGIGAEEAAALIEEKKLYVHHWFFSSDLTAYYRGGRISKTSAVLGGLLNICPLLNVNGEGKLTPVMKCRGKKKAMSEIVRRMEELAENGHEYSGKCFMCQSDCIDDAKKVASAIEEKFPNIDGGVMINNIGTVIGAHTGPGTVALFFFGDKRE